MLSLLQFSFYYLLFLSLCTLDSRYRPPPQLLRSITVNVAPTQRTGLYDTVTLHTVTLAGDRQHPPLCFPMAEALGWLAPAPIAMASRAPVAMASHSSVAMTSHCSGLCPLTVSRNEPFLPTVAFVRSFLTTTTEVTNCRCDIFLSKYMVYLYFFA